MKLYIVFGQRKENYSEQYAPEALAIIDEYGNDENPEYIQEQRETYLKDKSFVNVDVVEIDLGCNGQDAIRNYLLMPLKLKADVKLKV